MVKKYEGTDFQELVSDGVTFVKFYADWCNPCRLVAPQVEQVARETEGINFVEVDIDKYGEIAAANNVKSIPALILFKDGNEVARKGGFAPADALAKWIEQSL